MIGATKELKEQLPCQQGSHGLAILGDGLRLLWMPVYCVGFGGQPLTLQGGPPPT